MLARERKQCCLDHPGESYGFGPLGPAVQGFFDLTVVERADRHRDQSVSEVAIGIQLHGRNALDVGMLYVNGVRDERCRDIGGRRILS